MSALYSRISSFVPAPSSLPLVSRLTRLQDMLSRSHDLAADAGADVVDHSLEPLSHAALEIRAMERGLGPWCVRLPLLIPSCRGYLRTADNQRLLSPFATPPLSFGRSFMMSGYAVGLVLMAIT